MISDDLIVYHNGKPAIKLNAQLIAKQDLTDDEVLTIKSLHEERIYIEELLETAQGSNIKSMYQKWRENQFMLQDAWHFERNENYFRSWYLKPCVCAKIDNDDAYPTGYYSHRLDCPIHGDQNV